MAIFQMRTDLPFQLARPFVAGVRIEGKFELLALTARTVSARLPADWFSVGSYPPTGIFAQALRLGAMVLFLPLFSRFRFDLLADQ